MKVALWVDMEGTSGITDHRECWPAFENYWQSGRNKLMSDVAASARGLLEGGASEVIVVNAHGLGWPNILAEKLPNGTKIEDSDNSSEGSDAMLQVGFHSRAGTANGFLSHTMVPNINSINLNGDPLTESHIWAFLSGIPLIGVVGDNALGSQLDGLLKGIPFLGVKNSSSRTDTKPVFPSSAESEDAIQKFAKESMENKLLNRPALPKKFKVSIEFDPEIGAEIIEVEAKNWAQDVQPAIEEAMGTAMQSFFEVSDEIDTSSEESLDKQNKQKLRKLREYFIDFAEK